MRWADSLALLREYGPGWVTHRGAWELALRSGRIARRLPARPAPGTPGRSGAGWEWDSTRESLRGHLHTSARRFFVPGDPRTLRDRIDDPDDVVARADDVLRGRLVLFAHRAWDVGHPPDWFRSPLTGTRWPADVHWMKIDELSAERGDIKAIWEIARFGQTYLLARAFALTDDARYPEAFFVQAEDWIAANPPETGPHWRCGQEVSLRLLAWMFGLHAFLNTPVATNARLSRLIESIHDHARHIEAVHGFAVHSLRNNHAISEATALFTIGVQFPFLPDSARWRRAGRESLGREAWQVYADGSYVQHSSNYARLVAQLYAWVLALCATAEVEPPEELVAAARRLVHFLVGLQDRASGALPSYGPNDGTLLLPLASCAYADYRPALHALAALLGEGPLYGPGPWEEAAAWLNAPPVRARGPVGGPVAVEKDVAPGLMEGENAPVAFREGGYYRLDGRNTHAIIRCGAYEHRPHQADMLHLDVWFQGRNILVDAGTYLYNAGRAWMEHFTGTGSHNSVTVDGRDQMRRGERFLWHDWVAGHLDEHRVTPRGAVFRGHHDGYRPVRHTRCVIVRDDLWLVIDDLAGGGEEHTFRLHWLVADEVPERDDHGATLLPGPAGPLRLECRAVGDPAGNWERGNEQVPRGWWAPYYGERVPAWSYELVARGQQARFVTLIGPADAVRALLPLRPQDAKRLAREWESGPAAGPAVGSAAGPAGGG